MLGPLLGTTDLAAFAAWATNPLVSFSDDGLAVFGLFGIGLYLIYDGFRKWKQMRLMQDTPTEKIRSAATGRTELKGTCRPLETIIDAPFTDQECVVATFEVEEWQEDSDDDGGSWNTIEEGTLCTPFELDDGTGRMRVEPERDATYEIGDQFETTFRVGGGRSPPGEVAEFFEQRHGDDDGVLGLGIADGLDARDSNRRRYTQEIIPPGEDLYALGGASTYGDGTGSNAEQLALGRDEGSDQFIISTLDEESLVSKYRFRAPAQIAGGLGLSAVMLFLFLSGA